MKELIYNKFKASPVILAFLNGVLVSAGINLLTGITSSDKLIQIIFSCLSAVSFMTASVLMIIWQNKSSNVQEEYEKWYECLNKNKATAGCVSGITDKIDWISYLNFCCSYDAYIADKNKIGKEHLVRLNYKKLCSLYVFMWIFFALGIVSLIISVVFAFIPV